MIGQPDVASVDRFRDAVVRQVGLYFDEGRLGFLGEVLQRRLEAHKIDADGYLSSLERGSDPRELGKLAEQLTVGETYFFRNNDQFRAFAEVVLPGRMRANAASRRLRFLSAGCASGEEPYTLAIILRELVADPAWHITIRAVDANPAALRKAAAARYSSWSLRDTPAEIQQKWFRPSGRDALLDESIRSAVAFEERNIAIDDAELWQPQSFDAIFCRNVIMYFTPAGMRAAVARMARALAPGGYLFLGHAETLRGLSGDFHLCHSHDTFYYQRHGQDDAPNVNFDISRLPVSLPKSAPPVAPDDSWVTAIGRAADRVAALTAPPSAPSARSAPAMAAPAWNTGLALDLLRQERFGDAIELIDAMPPGSRQDRDVLLLQAVLLAHAGQTRRAAETALRLLALDEMNAGGNYVIALCCEDGGDRATALKHYRTALYLDPSFAMARLHLGMLLRKCGELEEAGNELKKALALLENEDASRLLLFGSGFTRDALIALCRSEIGRCKSGR